VWMTLTIGVALAVESPWQGQEGRIDAVYLSGQFIRAAFNDHLAPGYYPVPGGSMGVVGLSPAPGMTFRGEVSYAGRPMPEAHQERMPRGKQLYDYGAAALYVGVLLDGNRGGGPYAEIGAPVLIPTGWKARLDAPRLGFAAAVGWRWLTTDAGLYLDAGYRVETTSVMPHTVAWPSMGFLAIGVGTYTETLW